MARREYDMKSIFDIPQWELIQDKLAKLTGTAIISIDYKGTPVTKHSERTEFCSVIRENPVSRKRCYRCDSLAGLEAVRLERPYIYLCHCGIVDVAVPVMVGDRYLGAVMFGQVRIPDDDDNEAKVVRLVNEISSFEPDSENAKQDLMELYEKLPKMKYEKIVLVAELINSMVQYIVDRAVKSRNEHDTYQWLLRNNSDSQALPQEEMRELMSPLGEDESPASLPVSKSSAVYPAVVHIHEHLLENLSMKDMADLCHLSPSYFSRTFTRDVGESFVSYTNRKKIELSKRMLRETNKNVSQIASELGFQDSGHFINLFKKFEGTTPTVFRQYDYK